LLQICLPQNKFYSLLLAGKKLPIYAALLNLFFFSFPHLVDQQLYGRRQNKSEREKYIYIRRNENEVNATAGSVYVRPSNTLERRFFVFFFSQLCVSLPLL
jgi:hypothetical protein